MIVGAGPTGLAAANLLGLAGIDTLLLERNAFLSDCSKAISIDDEGLRICQAMGLSEAICAETLLDIDAHYIARGHFLARVAPTSNRNGYPLISTFHQPTFEAILLKGLERFACVEILFQHTVETFEQDEQSVRLSVRRSDGALFQLECAYLLACDGGKSTIRQGLNIPMHPATLFVGTRGKTQVQQRRAIDHSQRWLVVDCINDDDPSAVAIFFCTPTRPAVTVPAPHNGRRWEFMLLPGEREEDLLDVEIIQDLIMQARKSQQPNGDREDIAAPAQIIRHTVYTFHSALATTFSRGRVFLLGDAAHLMPPFGGQGMNSGLRDAHNLCWKLQMVLQGLASSHLLETYHQERYPHVSQMILFSWLLGKIIMPTARPIALLRDLFFRGINTIPPVREALTEARVKPQPKYTNSYLLPTHSGESKRLTGILLPQPRVVTPEGKRILLDDALGSGFTLLRLYENPAETFTALRDDQWERLGVRFVCIQPAHPVAAPIHNTAANGTRTQPMVVIDIEQQLSALLRHNHDLYVLVRPDRYIMGAFQV
ncbi:MAG: FAD-dependent monooxygenase [Chloroflexi bacterium]|nr:FAD-dependent monooxygenase [Chloroflexota bacterium]